MFLFCRTGLGKLDDQLSEFLQRLLPGDQQQWISLGILFKQPGLNLINMAAHIISFIEYQLRLPHPVSLNPAHKGGADD